MASRKRHLAKTITWRILASADTFLLAWLVTGSVAAGGTISALEVLTKMFLYYGHERAWYKVKWGTGKDELKAETEESQVEQVEEPVDKKVVSNTYNGKRRKKVYGKAASGT